MRLAILFLLLAVPAFGAEAEGSLQSSSSFFGTVLPGGGSGGSQISAFVGISAAVTSLYANGIACVSNSYCASGLCLHGTCRASFPYCSDNFCDIGETCSSCAGDCGGCSGFTQSSSQQSLMGAVGSLEGIESDLLRSLNASTLEVLNRQAEELAKSGRLDELLRRLDRVYAVVSNVSAGLFSDANALDYVLLSDSVPELGLEPKDISQGKEVLTQASLLLKQAEKETNPVRKAYLLKEAIMQELKAVEMLPEVSLDSVTFDSPPVTKSEISSALRIASSPEARAAISSMSPNNDIALTRTLEVYRITNLEKTRKEAFRSRILLALNAAEDISNLRMVEAVPKSVSATSTELAFSPVPEILQEDPIFSWGFKSLPARGSVNVSYVLKKRLEGIGSTTLVSGETVFRQPVLLSPPILCGDGKCEQGENIVNCPQDCKLLCAKKATSAVSPSGECREFVSPCEVPEGWSRVLSCSLPIKSREVGKGTLLLFLIAFSSIASMIMVSIRTYSSARSRRYLQRASEEERRMLEVEKEFKLKIMKGRPKGLEAGFGHEEMAGLTPAEERALRLRESLELSRHRADAAVRQIETSLGAGVEKEQRVESGAGSQPQPAPERAGGTEEKASGPQAEARQEAAGEKGREAPPHAVAGGDVKATGGKEGGMGRDERLRLLDRKIKEELEKLEK